ncbi:hypothetical protein [Gloeocapsopsis dulcis]|uniref:Uncharacterized protein n=1 Tax=Gloeocapsopsis dulcis AAB1 = 1H9 TaxID=1433147 RepID=A0A6N8G1Z9_9CHRO|nr:hypothetical protein [Gloeocapsopsis dulcis]MUL39438.1 hypothetical protein [Gloeocapsopsis dulcis AAB1 = 1H9]WNN92080.1 hypothetical protein P0S91_25470 [Gloeocapsopsis dulcis]
MTQPNYGIARYQSAIKVSQLPSQDQQNPVYNNNPNSAADNNYPYNPPQQRAQEPIVTDANGTQSSKPASPEQNYNRGLLGLRVALKRSLQRDVQQPPTVPNANNSPNLGIAKEQFNMQDVNYKEMIPYLEKMQNRAFNRDAVFMGAANLGNALGGNASYQQWWSGGLVK